MLFSSVFEVMLSEIFSWFLCGRVVSNLCQKLLLQWFLRYAILIVQETRRDWYKLTFDRYCMFALIYVVLSFSLWDIKQSKLLYSLGGELFMHLEREGIFMEDTAW